MKKYFLIAILTLGFLGSFSLVQAGCCVNIASSLCTSANTATDCLSIGLSDSDYYASICSDIPACPTYGKTSNGCCIISTDTNNFNYGKSANCFSLDTSDLVAADANCPKPEKIVLSGSCSSQKECGASSSILNKTNTIDTSGTAAANNNGSTNIPFPSPLQIQTLPDLLASILSKLRGIIVIIAIIFIVIGGIMYMTSAGNEKMVTRAKQTWTGAVVGLAIALAAPAFLNEILAILQAGPDVAGTGSDLTIKQIAINVLNFLLSIFGVLAIISLIIGGGMYLTAYGDEKKIDSGKKIITYAIIGIVVALSALVVTRQIAGLIGVTP
jgi:hypothetical protein